MFLKADVLMSVNAQHILQPTLLQHQHFSLSTISWNKIPIFAPAFCSFTIQPHSEIANSSAFLSKNKREDSRNSDLRQMLESEFIFYSPAAVLAIDEFSWSRHEKEEEKGKDVFQQRSRGKGMRRSVFS